jgi:integrase
MANLQTREARKKLKARDKPYFHPLNRGLALGYRRDKGAAGSWLLREFRKGHYVQRRIGSADDTAPADGDLILSWKEAQAKALDKDRPTVTKGKFTVRDAAQTYFKTRKSTAPHDPFTWSRYIEPKLGDSLVNDLTTDDIEAWLAELVPATNDREKRRRARASANRYFNVLRAILNSAYRKNPKKVPSADAWRRVQAFANADQSRTRTLTADEAKRLLDALPQNLQAIARGSLLTGLRFGELTALQAGDIGKDFVRVRISKSGKPRTVPLNREGATFFASVAAGKATDVLIFEPITRTHVSRLMRKACVETKIDPPAVFHDLRRSYGSLLINSGTSVDVIQGLLGHADPRMTRRTYAHMVDATMQKAVKKLPSFS